MLQHLGLAAGAAFDERSRVRPDVSREFAELGTRQQVAPQSVEAAGIARVAAEPVDERQHHAIELATERMVGIVANLFEERGRGRDDPVHQELVGAIEFQQRRQFAADFLADHRHGIRLGQRAVNGAQDVVEQPVMPALLHESAQGSGGERGEIDRLQLGGDAAGDEGHQARTFRRRYCLGQQTQHEAGEIGTSLALAQPVGNERAEIDLAQLGVHRCGFEKMHLDEFAELVGDTLLIALDDRGMRNRQSQRPAEQRHHGVPVGQPADLSLIHI